MNEEALDRKYNALIDHLIETGMLKTSTIIRAFRRAQRYKFTPEEYMGISNEDTPIQIAVDSTISQPSTVAVMLEELNPKSGEKVLEIGTGSGWQAAILSFCVGAKGKVVTVEIDKEVFKSAQRNINKFDVDNIAIVNDDGAEGYPKESPYDKIIFTAALPERPITVMKQLKIGGILIAPVGDYPQTMVVLTKISDSKYGEKDINSFLFVQIKRAGSTK